MRGIFLKTPTVRMGSQNYMRGTTETLTASRGLGGCALIRFTLRGAGGGGGGAGKIVSSTTGEQLSGSDGERGAPGALQSNRTGHVRPSSAGYVHRNGGDRGISTVGDNFGVYTGAPGDDALSASFLDVSAGGGEGGRGGMTVYGPYAVDPTNYIRVPNNVSNPDGLSTAGRGGFGGNKNSTSSPFYGASSGQSSRAWMTILD